MISKEKQRDFFILLRDIICYSEVAFDAENFDFIDTGSKSIILLKENNAWKFSKNIDYEANLLSKLKDSENVESSAPPQEDNIKIKENEFLDLLAMTGNYSEYIRIFKSLVLSDEVCFKLIAEVIYVFRCTGKNN